MLSQYKPSSDFFEPLRAFRPPVSAKEFRLAHRPTPNNKIWNYRGIATGITAILTVALGICFVTFYAHLVPRTTSGPKSESVTIHALSDNITGSIYGKTRMAPNRILYSKPEHDTIANISDRGGAEDCKPLPASETKTVREVMPEASNKSSAPAYLLQRTSEPLHMQAKNEYYASLQAGAIMGSLNTLGGGFALTATSDWMQATFRYTSTFGTSTSEIFSKTPGKSGSQNVNEYAFMVGARLEQGSFWASIEAGPNIIHANFQSSFGNDTTMNSIGGSFGASAQATFGYKFSNNFGASLTGFVSNHSITYGGILLSVAGGVF